MSKPKLTAVQSEHLANWIDEVADRMSTLAEHMQSYGFSRNLTRHGREMAGAAKLAKGWARGIREHR